MNINVPPPPGYDPNSANMNQDGDPFNDGTDLRANAPKVSSAPAKIFVVIGVMVAFVLLIAYLFMRDDTKKEEDLIKNEPKKIAQDTSGPDILPPPPAQPLPPPKPLIPPPAPQIVPPPMPAPPVARDSGETAQNRKERLGSAMLIFNGKSGTSAQEEDDEAADAAFAGNDPNSSFAHSAVKASKVEKVKAGRLMNPSAMIAQGKIVHAVLETAINTQLPGIIRAIVSHDIYAEHGNARLIPKGSRLIGTYNTNMFRGQSRIYIVWTRVIRPDGIDIMIGSPGVDQLGRAGMGGHLDSRYFEIFSSAVLTSILGIGIAKIAEDGLGIEGDGSTTTNTDGSTTSNTSPTGQATINAVNNITQTSESIVKDMVDTRTVVTVDQGTPVNVMVNRDLIFPSDATGSGLIIQ